jgi:hypothetical protein
MLELLQNIFSEVSLSEIDNLKEFEESKFYSNFVKSFPNLPEIFCLGVERDKDEFIRTIRHIFRSIKIYLEILEKTYSYSGFSDETLSKIFHKIQNIQGYNQLLIPLILIYHDIGKFIRKRDHPHQSYILISERDLLAPFKLSENDKLLVEKVIEYHILFATIYTGESTYYGTYSLIKDISLVRLLSDQTYLKLFVNLLEIFTYIDILGYSYSQIFDHYVVFYKRINQNLKDIFSLLPDTEKSIKKSFQYSIDWIEWRIAGALRIFQFIGTEPYLTEQFYYNIIKASLDDLPFEDFNFKRIGWDNLIETELRQSSKIQIKYGLAFLMILTFGSFHRATIKEDVKISHKLLLFWLLLCREVQNRSYENKNAIWNVYILGITNWFALSRKDFSKIDEHLISMIIKSGNSSYDKKLKEYTLNLDLSSILF